MYSYQSRPAPQVFSWCRAFLLLALFGLMSLGAGCSSEPKADACDAISCDSGVCDPNTKQCVNPKTCTGDEACLPGFSCEASQCVADIACDSSNQCERGQCVDGACMNATTCAVEADCVSGYYCGDDSVCRVNNCEDTTCDRGQCIPSTGQCANAATCTRATEKVDCLEDNYCLGQICVSASTVCEELGCENGRGVCDPAARACVNADNCEGNDQNCVAGSFCNAANKCQINKCEPDTGQCDRGVCSPDNGSCINVDTCTGLAGCVDGFLCIGGTCESTTTACASCTGNQICSQNETDLSAQCGESPYGCFNGLGCLDDRVCQAGSCIDSPTCEADSFEPNNTLQEATDLNAAMQAGIANASLCNGDVDFFKFDTRSAGLTRGTLLTEIRTKSEDIGNTKFKVIVRNPAGEIRAEGTSSNTGIIALEVPINAAQQGVYTIEVQDLSGTKTAGLRYAVFSQLIPSTVTAACSDNVKTLTPGLINGNTLDGRTYEMGSSCTTEVNTAREHIYKVTIDQRSHVNFIARPAADVEITMSLRHSCTSMLSELECANLGGRGKPERLTMTLDPGTYFLIVKGPKANTGGAYTLEYTRETTVCHPGVPYCTNEQTSAVCNDRGTAHTKVLCENGCVEDGGYCDGEPGDTCYVAIDATGGFTGTIDWSKLNGDYKLGKDAEKCLPVNSSGDTIGKVEEDSVGGPDQTFVVNVGAGETLQVDLITTKLDYGSIYLVEDCQTPAATCLAGAFTAVASRGEFKKSLVWTNPSNQSQRVYVVADGGKSWIGNAKIQIAHGPPVCEPNSTQCVSDTLETCNISGTAYQTSRECSFGCGITAGKAACNLGENNVCKGAFDILARGGTYEGFIDDYTNNYNPSGRGCAGQNGAAGPDATFFVDADKGDVITAVASADFNAALWVTTDCSNAARSCVAGSNEGALSPEFISFAAPEKGRYYIVMDSYDKDQYGKFRLDVRVELPMCPPGNLIGCAADGKTLMFCGELGAPVPHICETSCSGMACDQPNGDVCYDAIPVHAGETVAGIFNGRNTLRPGAGTVGQCTFQTNDSLGYNDGPVGPDRIYSIDLKAGQSLHVTGHVQSLTNRAIFYLLEDCHNAQSCLSASSTGSHPDVAYTATEDRTVFLVASRTQAGTSDKGYSLTFNVFDPECETGERTCLDNSTQQFCNSFNYYETFACPNGCQAGSCIEPSGDVCADAIELHHLDVVTGNFLGSNAIEPGKSAGQCTFGDHNMYGGPGSDTFYRIEMQAGQRLVADLRSGTSATMYILEDCSRASTCLVNTPNQLNDRNYRLEYVSDRDKTIYLVVDGTIGSGPSAQTFELSIDLQTGDCANPGEYSCLEDRKTLGLCGDDGQYSYYRCADSCRIDRCERTASGGLCIDQIKIKSGDRVTGNFDHKPNMVIDPADAGACTFASLDAPLHSPSTMYSIDMQQGELLIAKLDSRSTQSLMYVLDDCAQGTSSCQEASPAKAQGSELMYVADSDKTITLVVASSSTTRSKSEFHLEVNLQSPGCMGDDMICLDNKTLGVCTQEGYYAPHRCADGCENDRCKTPHGDFCEDAIELIEGVVTKGGEWNGWNTIDPGPGISGACNFGTTGAPGREVIYVIDAPDATVVRVKITPESTGTLTQLRMYLLEECGDTESCRVTTSADQNEFVFINEFARPLYLVVDRATEGVSTAKYDLLVTFEPAGCIPNEVECNPAGTGVQICNDLGIWVHYGCSSNSCTAGTCDNPNGSACLDAIPVQSGQTVTGDWNTPRSSLNPGNGIVGQCNFAAAGQGTGRDTIYSVDMKAGETLRAELSGASLSYQMMYILDDCFDGKSCLANTLNTSAVLTPPAPLYYVADRDKTVFVVVDRNTTTASTVKFSLRIDLLPPACSPGERQCDEDVLKFCTDANQWDTSYVCAEGCNAGACNEPRGNSCFDAIPLVPNSGRVSGDWNSANRVNSSDPGTGISGACNFGTSTSASAPSSTAGPDTIYAIPVKAGETLRADLKINDSSTSNLSSVRMYMLSSCEDTQSCIMIAPNPVVNKSTLLYEPLQDGVVYLVVDISLLAGKAVTYDLVVTSNPDCTAGAQRCSADGAMVEICNGTNNTYDSFACANDSCSNGTCDTPTGQFCQDAILLESGDRVQGKFPGVQGIMNPNGAQNMCSFTAAMLGGETTYAIELLAGEVLTATGTSANPGELAMYILEDGCDLTSCVATKPYVDKGASVTLEYAADIDRTVLIVVDARYASNVSTFELSVSVDHIGNVCSFGERHCVDSSTLAFCNEFGTFFNTYECEGGCSDGKCGTMTGTVCHDAIPIQAPFEMKGVYVGATENMDPGVGTCVLANSLTNGFSRGKDRVFAIELEQGDLMKATLSGHDWVTTQTGMYILDNCDDSVSNACLVAVIKASTLEFYAPRTQTYYLVVDGTTSAHNNMNLKVNVEKAAVVCQPDSSTCDPVTGVLEVCSADGSKIEGYLQCEYGCGLTGRCAAPPVANNTCDTAKAINASVRLFDVWERFGTNYNLNTAGCGNGAGRDAVYKVTLAPGQLVRATAESLHTSYQAVVYLVEECPDTATSCLTTATSVSETDKVPKSKAVVEYLSINGGEYFLIVDSSSTAAINPFVLDIELEMAECLPGAARCTQDGLNQDVCSPVGLWEVSPCAYGCGGDVCLPVPNDTCAGAFDASNGLDINISMADYSNVYDAAAGIAVSCTGDYTNGPEAVFYVDVEKNDLITATLSDTNFESAVWIASDCSSSVKNIADSCVIGQHKSSGSSTVSYRAPEAGRYFIFADSYYSKTIGRIPTGMMRVKIDVTPAVCDAFEVTCLDADTVAYCLANGSSFAEYTCNDGCNNGLCGTPRGGLCTDAIVATAGGIFTGNFSDVPNTSDPGFGSCTGFEAPGRDAFYAVDLTAGQTLKATLANGTGVRNDLSLYVVTDCTESRDSCLVGSDKYGYVAETVTYTATQSGTVYVVADAWNADASGEYKLAIDIQ